MVRLPPVLILIIAALSAGCASGGHARPSPFPTPGGHPATTPVDGSASGSAIAQLAVSFVGAPYRTGGSTPAGFDCSGLVEYVFARNGVAMPRTVAEQYRVGRSVRRGNIEAGDLVFFHTVSRSASHVGISLGGDDFVHAPSGRGEVRIEHLSARYWASRFVGARRIED